MTPLSKLDWGYRYKSEHCPIHDRKHDSDNLYMAYNDELK